MDPTLDGDRLAPSPPLPTLTPETHAFFTRGAVGELVIHRCDDCGHFAHPPSPRCPVCWGASIGPVRVSGHGRVLTFTVNHYQWHPAFPPPYVVAIVELDEQPGLRLTTRLVGVEPDEVQIGDRVSVVFEAHGEIHLPLFEPADPDHARTE